MTLYSFKSNTPEVDSSVYINDGATVIGQCKIGQGSSIWPGAVLRGDNDQITLGKNVNVQDGAVIHVDVGHPATIGDGVSIAHLAMVHGATIGENTLIGMHSTILNDAIIGKNCIIGANTVVTSGKVIPDNSLVIGTPGKVLRQVTPEEIENNIKNALSYQTKAIDYKMHLKEIK